MSSCIVVDLFAHLLGYGQLDGLVGRVGQAGDALLEGLGDNLDLRDGVAFFLGKVLARDPGARDGHFSITMLLSASLSPIILV